MRKTSYWVAVCFNEETIISCSCQCRAGCSGNGRVLCVHILPVLYLITLQMYDGLADNIIIEVANNWKRLSIGMGEDVKKLFRTNILLLKNATNQLVQPMRDHLTIEELLETYLVGTKRPKFEGRSKQKQVPILCPLRHVKLLSSYKATGNILTQQQDVSDVNEEDNEQNKIKPISKQTYQNIVKYIVAFVKCICGTNDLSQIQDYVGYQVLNLRAVPITFATPGDIREVKRNVVRLIELSNNKIRVRKRNKRKILTSEDNNSIIDTDDCIIPDANNNMCIDDTDIIDTDDCIIPDANNNMCIDDTDNNVIHTYMNNVDTDNSNNNNFNNIDSNDNNTHTYMNNVDKDNNNNVDTDNNNNVDILYNNNVDTYNIINIDTCFNNNDIDTEEGIEENQHTDFRRYKKRYKCCACDVTSLTDKQTTFANVPYTNQASLKVNDSERKRKTFYKRIYTRKYILKRFMLNQSDPRKDLRYCGNHDWEFVCMDYPWLTRNGKWETETQKFRLPVDPTDPPSRTRGQQQTRQPLERVDIPLKNEYLESEIKKKTGTYRSCCFWNCNNKGTIYKSIPRIPTITERSKKINSELMRYYIKNSFRNNCLYCCGLNDNGEKKDFRICDEHEIEKVSKEVKWIDNNKQTRCIMTTMYLPKMQSGNITISQNRRNSGLGMDRWINRQVDFVINSLSQDVAQTVGLLHLPSTEQTLRVEYDKKQSGVRDKVESRTTIRFSKLSDNMVKDRTGYQSVHSMLAFIVVVCEGDFDSLQECVSQLTWLEEWFLYFEVVWGKSTSRWVDVAHCYVLSVRSVRRIFDSKLNKHVNSLKKWPMFVDYVEDKNIRKEQWSEHYGERRIVMWDNTSLPMYKPSLSSAQQDTYSAYYAGNVAKGGVFIQPCGWIGTHELWVGSVSDTEYMEKSMAYKRQQTYLTEHDPNNCSIGWTIIFDKGYRVSTSTWSDDHQCEVIQPTFARSDVQFTDYETLRSAAVASDRSANERAVCWSKRCNFLSRGLLPNECPRRFSDVWIAWGFQANFTYKPVL